MTGPLCTICGRPIVWTDRRTTHLVCEVGWEPSGEQHFYVPPADDGEKFSLPSARGQDVAARSDGRPFSYWLTDLVEREAER